MKDIITSNGSGKMHLGWLVPGEKVCLGVGPVSLRFSRKEAISLHRMLTELLAEQEPRGNCTPCGCPQSHEPAPIPAAPVRFFWDDENGT
jgi:hypothetical protein